MLYFAISDELDVSELFFTQNRPNLVKFSAKKVEKIPLYRTCTHSYKEAQIKSCTKRSMLDVDKDAWRLRIILFLETGKPLCSLSPSWQNCKRYIKTTNALSSKADS